MPFHIQHTGPAPVSTYFRIQPHVGPSSQSPSAPDPSPLSRDSQAELTTATLNSEAAPLEEKEDSSMAVDADPAVADPAITAAAEVDIEIANAKAPASPVLRC